LACDEYFKFYIWDLAVSLRGGQVLEGLGIAGGAGGGGDKEGLQRGHGGYPGGDGGGEALGEEGAEGLVLPGLDVAGGPVVEQADAEEVLGGFGDGDWRAEEVGLADVKS